MAKLDKEQFNELCRELSHIFRSAMEPALIEEARRTAEGVAKHAIREELQTELQSAVRKIVRERVHAEVRVVLKEKE